MLLVEARLFEPRARHGTVRAVEHRRRAVLFRALALEVREVFGRRLGPPSPHAVHVRLDHHAPRVAPGTHALGQLADRRARPSALAVAADHQPPDLGRDARQPVARATAHLRPQAGTLFVRGAWRNRGRRAAGLVVAGGHEGPPGRRGSWRSGMRQTPL
jgi:hypothetical protein